MVMDAAFDVPDSTDWLSTPLKDLASLENALHCQICKEFYDTPMITSCAHTFCSKCIRTSLSADGKCPACRSADQASKLRNNWALQETVSMFIAARPAALQVARRAQEEEAESKRPAKRKRPNVSDVDNVDGSDVAGRTTRSKSRRLAASQSSQADILEIDDTDNDGDFEPYDIPENIPSDGLVECPLGCGKRMKIEAVEPHLDRCEEEREREKKSSRTHVNGFSAFRGSIQKGSRPLERISELNYSLLKDAAMTKKLNELGIPSWGSKPLMINRHREWVNLWNANCDSSAPRSKRDLLHDLDVWERTQGGRAPNPNGLTNSVMRKDFDGAGWAKKNQDDFSRLIADARRKKHVPQPDSSPKDKPPSEDQLSSSARIPNERINTEVLSSAANGSRFNADDAATLLSIREQQNTSTSRQPNEPIVNAGFNHNVSSMTNSFAQQSSQMNTATLVTEGQPPAATPGLTESETINRPPIVHPCNVPAGLSTQDPSRTNVSEVPKPTAMEINGILDGRGGRAQS